jgi:hypothetical protein
MEIYIDNKKIESLEKKKFKSLGAALNALNKMLKEEDKILHTVSVNGVNIPENTFSKMKDISLIEIKTKTYRSVILEAFCVFREYSENYFDIIENIENYDELFGSEEKIGEVLSFLSWTYSLLISLNENTTLDLIYEDLTNFIEDFKVGIEEAKIALENSDFDEFLDILEFDLGSLISSIYHMIDEYFEIVAKEESRKSLIN